MNDELEVRALAIELSRGLRRPVEDVLYWLTGHDRLERRRLELLLTRQASIRAWRARARHARRMIDQGAL